MQSHSVGYSSAAQPEPAFPFGNLEGIDLTQSNGDLLPPEFFGEHDPELLALFAGDPTAYGPFSGTGLLDRTLDVPFAPDAYAPPAEPFHAPAAAFAEPASPPVPHDSSLFTDPYVLHIPSSLDDLATGGVLDGLNDFLDDSSPSSDPADRTVQRAPAVDFTDDAPSVGDPFDDLFQTGPAIALSDRTVDPATTATLLDGTTFPFDSMDDFLETFSEAPETPSHDPTIAPTSPPYTANPEDVQAVLERLDRVPSSSYPNSPFDYAHLSSPNSFSLDPGTADSQRQQQE